MSGAAKAAAGPLPAAATAGAGARGSLGGYARRAVLMQVGAMMAARDRLAPPNEREAAAAAAIARPAEAVPATGRMARLERRGITASRAIEREFARKRRRADSEIGRRAGEHAQIGNNSDRRRGDSVGRLSLHGRVAGAQRPSATQTGPNQDASLAVTAPKGVIGDT
jgi:hypothetical protein